MFSQRLSQGIINNILISIISVILFAVPGSAEDKSHDETIFDPENSSLIYAYAGYGYYNWKMIGEGEISDIFVPGIPSTGMKLKHEATPYTVKKYCVKSNIKFISVGFDYFGDKLDLPAGFDSEEKYRENEDKHAKQFRYLSGLKFNDMYFQFNVTHREFDSTITSHGYKPLLAAAGPIYYYPENGSVQYLNNGDKIAWYTTYTEYEGKVAWNTDKKFSIEFGLKYITFNAPTETSIKTYSNANSGQILLFTENHLSTLFIGLEGQVSLGNDFYFLYHIPVEVAGYYYINSDYFESRSNPLWGSASTSLTLATSGNLSLAYMLKHFRIEAGADFSLYTSTLMFDDKAKKDLSYPSLSDGSAVPVTAGEKTQVRVERTEFFWGLFMQASVYF